MMSRKISIITTVIACALFVWFFFTGKENEEVKQWNEIAGEHFVVFFHDHEDYASKVSDAAEEHYNRILSVFGFESAIEEGTPSSWEWERCKIFLHKKQKPENEEENNALFRIKDEKRLIDGTEGSNKFIVSELPVKIAELLLNEQVGAENPSVPPWLREGVAMLAENTAMDAWARNIRQAVKDKQHMDFESFNRFDPEVAAPQALQQYSAQAVSVVDFFIKTNGPEAFMELCARLKAGNDMDAALRSLSGKNMSLKKLEEQWLASVAPPSRKPEAAPSEKLEDAEDRTAQNQQPDDPRNLKMLEAARRAEKAAYRQPPDSIPAEAEEPRPPARRSRLARKTAPKTNRRVDADVRQETDQDEIVPEDADYDAEEQGFEADGDYEYDGTEEDFPEDDFAQPAEDAPLNSEIQGQETYEDASGEDVEIIDEVPPEYDDVLEEEPLPEEEILE